MTAVTLAPHPFVGVGNLWLQHCWCTGVLVQLWCCYFVVGSQATGLLVGNHIVDASSLVIFVPPLAGKPLLKDWFTQVVCGVSYRPISTGQLHESLVLASTSGLSTQWSGWGPLTHKVYGNLISKRASRLDAFSGYPIRT